MAHGKDGSWLTPATERVFSQLMVNHLMFNELRRSAEGKEIRFLILLSKLCLQLEIDKRPSAEELFNMLENVALSPKFL